MKKLHSLFFLTVITTALALAGCGVLESPPETRGKPPVVRATRPYTAPARQPQETAARRRPAGTEAAGAEAVPPETAGTMPVSPAIIPQPVTPVPPVSEPEPAINQAEIDYVAQRLKAYEKKFQAWLELQDIEKQTPLPDMFHWDTCTGQLGQLLSSYSALLEGMQANNAMSQEGTATLDPAETYKKDVAFLESECAGKLHLGTASSAVDGSGREALRTARESEDLVSTLFAFGEYKEVVSAYEFLAENFTSHKIPAEQTELYGLALLHLGRHQDAAQVFSQILRGLAAGGSEDSPWNKRKRLADLLLAAGSLDEAYTQYEYIINSYSTLEEIRTWAAGQITILDIIDKGSEEMRAYLDLQRSFLAFDGKHHGAELIGKADLLIRIFPESPVADSARRIRQTVETELRSWLDEKLAEAASRLANKEYQEAQAILQELLETDLPLDMKNTVKKNQDDLLLAQAREQEAERLEIEQSQAIQWEAAVNALDSRRYDEAILYFKRLFDTDYDNRARTKIAEAAETAANDNRKQAASLFVKANRTSDPEYKKELLATSWRLLKEITIKYPQVEIIDRVLENLNTVDRHISELDPFLLENLKFEAEAASAEIMETGHEDQGENGNGPVIESGIETETLADPEPPPPVRPGPIGNIIQ